jgi:RNA polymerase sigma-70 factor, ECF subfamily
MAAPWHAAGPFAPRAARMTPGGASPAEDSDDALVERIATGDQRAWAAVIDRHSSAILGCAWRMLGERAEAEDVAQETFVRLMAKANGWQAGGPKLRTWLYRVAVNLCIDRRRARRTQPLEEIELRPDPGADEPAVRRRLDLSRSVGRALSALPDRQRMALTLVHFQGLSNIEAADALEVSVEALESLLSRARRAMRVTLEPDRADLLGDL